MRLFCLSIFASIIVGPAQAQLVWNQKMEKPSVVLPLTLDDDVYRVRCKPPDGVAPRDINCSIGITGTVLTDRRGTSSTDAAQKVATNLRNFDRIDVQFADRVFADKHDYAGNRVIEKCDFDCGINIKYQNKLKIAQVEIRVGYILPSGDIEGLTWAKIARKKRQLGGNIATCGKYQRDIGNLENERGQLNASASTDNGVQATLIRSRLGGISRQIDRMSKYVDRREEFERDLAAFTSIEEYLKTKLIGTQVSVRFDYKDQILPVDVAELKRNRLRPIQIFEDSKDPIKHDYSGTP